MTKWNLISAAAALSLAATPMAFAQQGGQTNAANNQNVNNQRLLQEQASGSGAQLMVSPAVVRQIKQTLNEAGYNPGAVNASWNHQAQRALQNYQQAQGLEPTGNINLSTLLTMGIYRQSGGGQMSGGYGQQMRGGQMQGGQMQGGQMQGGAYGNTGSYGNQQGYGNQGSYGNNSGYGNSSGAYGNSSGTGLGGGIGGNSGGTGVGGSVGVGGTSVGGNVGTGGIGGGFGNSNGQSGNNQGNSGNNNPPRS